MYFYSVCGISFVKMLQLKAFVGFLSLLSLAKCQVELGSMESWGFNGVSSDEVTLLSERKMQIKNLRYSGEGPAAWFMIGKDDDDFTTEFTNLDGVIIPDENGGCNRLGRYRGDDIELTLPAGLKFTDYDYLSIYCIRFSHNFGYIPIAQDGKRVTFPVAANVTATPTATPTGNETVIVVSAPAVAVATLRQADEDNPGEEDDTPGECDQEPERRGGGGQEEEEEEEE